jgi:SAM-dependent methyltransferase
MCGSLNNREVLTAQDGSRIVEYNSCGLWFTSPRIREKVWVGYLKSLTERSKEFTENRLKHGVALRSNIKYSLPDWKTRRQKKDEGVLNEIEKYLGRRIERLHDVGCGVGFLLKAAEARGIRATGNDLNKYACTVMNERLGLTIFNDCLSKLQLEENSLDAVVMNDYLEHTYTPFEDLLTSHRLHKEDGVIWIDTFHVDCAKFDELKEKWNMLLWNHVYHFSTQSISNIVKQAGFQIKYLDSDYKKVNIKLIAQKNSKK